MTPRARKTLRSASYWLDNTSRAVARMLLDDIFWMLMLAIGGAACLVAGVLMLAGTGWAFVAAGALAIVAAAILRRSMHA